MKYFFNTYRTLLGKPAVFVAVAAEADRLDVLTLAAAELVTEERFGEGVAWGSRRRRVKSMIDGQIVIGKIRPRNQLTDSEASKMSQHL